MAATRVQTKTANEASPYVTSFAFTFDSNVAAGNMIFFVIYYAASVAITDVSDGLGNTYNLINNGAGPYAEGAAYYAYNISGGSCTITVTFDGYANPAVVAREYSGLLTTDPLDVKAENLDGSYVNSHSCGTTAATSQNDELVIIGYTGDAVAAGNYSASGFSNLSDIDHNGVYGSVVMADKDVTSTGTQTGTFTSGSVYMNGWGNIATFKEAVLQDPIQSGIIPFPR